MISVGGLAQLDNGAAVREAAAQLRSAFDAVATRAGDVQSTWQRLAPHYQAPEQGQVLQAQDVPVSEADTLAGKAARAEAALTAYADRLEQLEAQKQALIADVNTFYADKAAAEAENADNNLVEDIWDGVTGEAEQLLERENELNDRAAQLQADKDAAERDCANAIGDIWGAPHYEAADDTWAGDETVYGMTADGYQDLSRAGDAPWGHPQMWSSDNWLVRGRMLLDGAGDSLASTLDFGGDLIGVGGAGQAKAAWSGLWQLGVDSFYVSGAGAVFASPQQRQESSDRLLSVGKGIIGWDNWDTSGWQTAGGLGFDAITAIGTGGGALAVRGSVRAGTATRFTRFTTGGRSFDVRGTASALRVRLDGALNARLGQLATTFGGPRPAFAGIAADLPTTGRSATNDGIMEMRGHPERPSGGAGNRPSQQWPWNEETRPLPGESPAEHSERVRGINRGDGRDPSGKYTGSDIVARRYESDGVAKYAQESGAELLTDVKPRIELEDGSGIRQDHRYYDALEVLGIDRATGELLVRGVEIKGPTAPYGGSQKVFDVAILRGRIATGTYQGRTVRVVDVIKRTFDGEELVP